MLKRNDLLYPELSYEILGAAFSVYNQLGWGHRELYYHRAFAAELGKRHLCFDSEKRVPLEYDSKQIGFYAFDFLIEDKIVVELKVQPRYGYVHINQVVSYLTQSGKRLAILIYFIKDGVRYRRVVHVPNS